jgi:hypothetical protein
MLLFILQKLAELAQGKESLHLQLYFAATQHITETAQTQITPQNQPMQLQNSTARAAAAVTQEALPLTHKQGALVAACNAQCCVFIHVRDVNPTLQQGSGQQCIISCARVCTR